MCRISATSHFVLDQQLEMQMANPRHRPDLCIRGITEMLHLVVCGIQYEDLGLKTSMTAHGPMC